MHNNHIHVTVLVASTNVVTLQSMIICQVLYQKSLSITFLNALITYLYVWPSFHILARKAINQVLSKVNLYYIAMYRCVCTDYM